MTAAMFPGGKVRQFLRFTDGPGRGVPLTESTSRTWLSAEKER